MGKQQLVLQPGELLSDNIKDQLLKANKTDKADFPSYMRNIEDIFMLDPIASLTKEQKQFFAGFTEGEGSINVSAKKTQGAKFGLVIDPEFSVTQHVNGICHLHVAMNLFKTGKLRYKAGSNATLVYIIDNRKTLTEKLLPFWEQYILPYSSPTKSKRMANFKSLLQLFDAGAHQEKNSLMYQILPLWDEMRMQKGQANETFASLKAAQEFVQNYTKK